MEMNSNKPNVLEICNVEITVLTSETAKKYGFYRPPLQNNSHY